MSNTSNYMSTALSFITVNQPCLLRKALLVSKDNAVEVTVLLSSENLNNFGLSFPSPNSSLFSPYKIIHSWIQQSNFEKTGTDMCTSIFNYTLKNAQRNNYTNTPNNDLITYKVDVNSTPYTTLYASQTSPSSSLYMSSIAPKIVKLTILFQ